MPFICRKYRGESEIQCIYNMKMIDIFYMLGVISYSAVAIIIAEMYEKRLSIRQKGRIHLKDIVLIALGGIFWIVVLPVTMLLNRICQKT